MGFDSQRYLFCSQTAKIIFTFSFFKYIFCPRKFGNIPMFLWRSYSSLHVAFGVVMTVVSRRTSGNQSRSSVNSVESWFSDHVQIPSPFCRCLARDDPPKCSHLCLSCKLSTNRLNFAMRNYNFWPIRKHISLPGNQWRIRCF